ncbi:hypothetical protein [Streptomyces sp. MB09-02B]|uniref:hypothetical protein n=1 Tax=Streptomyces sp. MB09-02B TaxID=3028667 RepID=UPI0029BD7447|nr:hypothetical protein [Streptomyces sp. MB09-02B]MDX3646334.1 hypothetical protein [Streptomyces sp. MB09-02B]
MSAPVIVVSPRQDADTVGHTYFSPVAGLGAQEIGLRLTLSEKTVRDNLSDIYAKPDVRGSTEAVLRWLGATPGVRA